MIGHIVGAVDERGPPAIIECLLGRFEGEPAGGFAASEVDFEFCLNAIIERLEKELDSLMAIRYAVRNVI